MEADDEGTYVVKFRGAGQGPKALVAELVGGEIGRALGLPVPEIVLVELDPAFARLEMDPELQHLLRASEGLDIALDFLPGSITFDPLVPPLVEPAFAAEVVWFDAFITNIDRTARNANMLSWPVRRHGPGRVEAGAPCGLRDQPDPVPCRRARAGRSG